MVRYGHCDSNTNYSRAFGIKYFCSLSSFNATPVINSNYFRAKLRIFGFVVVDAIVACIDVAFILQSFFNRPTIATKITLFWSKIYENDSNGNRSHYNSLFCLGKENANVKSLSNASVIFFPAKNADTLVEWSWMYMCPMKTKTNAGLFDSTKLSFFVHIKWLCMFNCS